MDVVLLTETDEPSRRDLDGVVGADLFERVRRPFGDCDRWILTEEYLALSARENETQRCRVAHPTRPRWNVGWLDVAALALPVDVGDFPRPGRQHDDPRTINLACQHDRVDLARDRLPVGTDRAGDGADPARLGHGTL